MSSRNLAAATEFYGRDPREIPAYSFHDVARAVRLPVSTLRRWTVGQSDFVPILDVPRDGRGSWFELSFFNLVESFVLGELRNTHGLSLQRIRDCVHYLQDLVGSAHPIVDTELHVYGKQLYAELEGRKINLSQPGQYPLEAVLRDLLQRIDKGKLGIERFYPYVVNARGTFSEQYKPIVVDPNVSFGRPRLAGTGIPTAVIAQRRRGGDSMRAIATDSTRFSARRQSAGVGHGIPAPRMPVGRQPCACASRQHDYGAERASPPWTPMTIPPAVARHGSRPSAATSCYHSSRR